MTVPVRIGVVGAGVMGTGIAQVMAVAGLDVVCVDRDTTALDRARQRLRTGRHGLERQATTGRISPSEVDAAVGRVRYTTDLAEGLDGCDVVIEAIVEDLAAKIALFRSADRLAPASTVLCTNSSGLPVAALAAATDRADRVLGWHWASPAPVMDLAEIVRTPTTDYDVVTEIVALAERVGKRPVVVWDAPHAWGYVANRVYAAAYREAEQIVREGVATPDQVDELLVDCFRWPVGPFTLARGANAGWEAAP